MTLFEHPLWQHVAPYAKLTEGRDNLDFLNLPDQLRALALDVLVNCVSCGRPIRCLRARVKSSRSRVGGTETERRLFYAPTCETEVNAGCSRTRAMKCHKDVVRAAMKLVAPSEVSGSIEVMDALCLQEPWLELILSGVKTLETRTRCLRKTAGEVVLTSSKSVDEQAWGDANVGGIMTEEQRQRARSGLGKLAGVVHLGGFRPGVPGSDDGRALIAIGLSDGGLRFVSEVSNPRRVARVETVRVQERGGKIEVVPGASQGFFRVPRSAVEVL